MRPLPRVKVTPDRNTSPPAKELMKIKSSGSGMSNSSPYISCSGITMGLSTPWAMGCEGLTVHTSSRSPSFRHASEQLVPSSLVKTVLIVGGEDRRRDIRLRVVGAKARRDGAVDAVRVDLTDVGRFVDGLV